MCKNQIWKLKSSKHGSRKLRNSCRLAENVEKIDLQAKLAEANAKLADTEFGKFKRELKDSNDEWLRGWSSWFLGVIGVFVAIFIGVGAVFLVLA